MVRTRPDGYSLTLVPLSVFRQPYLTKVQYDPLKDLSYIATVMNYTYAIAVPYSAPWKSIQELVADARKSPDKYSYAGSAQYSSNHLAMTELGVPPSCNGPLCPTRAMPSHQRPAGRACGHHQRHQHHPAVRRIQESARAGRGRCRALAGFPRRPTLKEAGYPVEMASPLGIAGRPACPGTSSTSSTARCARSCRTPTSSSRPACWASS
jgi:tripartite-type tricarboxylate transporter receptor subunit TctC